MITDSTNDMNERIQEIFDKIADFVGFDIDKIASATSVRIDTSYYVNQALLECRNMMQTSNPILALPKLNDVYISVIRETKIDVLSDDYLDIVTALQKIGQFYKTTVKPLIDEITENVDLEQIESIAYYEKIMQEHSKWFNTSIYLNVGSYRQPTNIVYSDKIYISDNPSQWLHSCVNKATEIENFDDCFVSTFIKNDKIDQHFSHFIFALIMNGAVYLIDDKIKFGSINKKFFTRRPERSKEAYFDNLHLPYDLLFDVKAFGTGSFGHDVIVYNDVSNKPADVVLFSSIKKEQQEFIQYMTNFFIENGHTLLDTAKLVSMHKDHNTKLLNSSQAVETEVYGVNKVEQYMITDILTQLNINEHVPNKCNIVTSTSNEALEKSKYYDKYDLCTSKENDDLTKWVARRTAVNNTFDEIDKKLSENKNQDQQFFRNLYDKDRMTILKRVFASKAIYVNRHYIKNVNYFNKERENKTYVLAKKERLVFDEKQCHEKYEFIFSEHSFAKTVEYGFKKEDCTCHHCELTNQTRKFPASSEAYFLAAHWSEIMWLFDLKDRNDLPTSLQIFQGDMYTPDTGNSILNDIDPITNLITLRPMYADTSFRRKHHIKFRFALCARCAKYLQKSSTVTNENNELIVDLDYKLLPAELISGNFEDYLAEVDEYNKIIETKYAGTGMVSHYRINVSKDAQ